MPLNFNDPDDLCLYDGLCREFESDLFQLCSRHVAEGLSWATVEALLRSRCMVIAEQEEHRNKR